MKPTYTAAAASIAIALAAASTIAFGQSALTPAGNDWPQIAANLGAQGYSGLTQINKSNIKNLGLAWMTHTSAEPVDARRSLGQAARRRHSRRFRSSSMA